MEDIFAEMALRAFRGGDSLRSDSSISIGTFLALGAIFLSSDSLKFYFLYLAKMNKMHDNYMITLKTKSFVCLHLQSKKLEMSGHLHCVEDEQADIC